MALTNSNLNKIFVFVPQANVASFKSGAGKQDAYKNKIAFLSGTGEIMTNGEVFAINKDSDITALETLIGTFNNLELGDSFNGSTLISAIQYVYDRATSYNTTLSGRLDTIQGSGEGSITYAVNDAITNLVNGAPEALDTLKEIADWISSDNGADAAYLVTRVENLEDQIEENEKVTSYALIDLQTQIDAMSGGAGSIQVQIDTSIQALDSTVTLAGSTATQPQDVGIDTTVDVLASITVAEVDGKVNQGSSSYISIKADAAGAARKAYDMLKGTSNDTLDMLTLTALKGRIDYTTRTGSMSLDNSGVNTFTYDTSTGTLASIENITYTLNSIEMWEEYSAS